MATPADAVRTELATVTAAALAELLAEVQGVPLRDRLDALLEVLGLLVPSYYDAAGELAVAWYDELRGETQPSTFYVPQIIGDPTTDWIEREVEKFRESIADDFEREMQRLMEETLRLAEKEVARGFRDSMLGNVRMDDEAIGWSRIARPGACKLCVMLADKGAVFSELTVFAAHTDCHCAARPEFRNGTHGPEASVMQYVASRKRRTDADRARLREYLNEHYPDAPG